MKEVWIPFPYDFSLSKPFKYLMFASMCPDKSSAQPQYNFKYFIKVMIFSFLTMLLFVYVRAFIVFYSRKIKYKQSFWEWRGWKIILLLLLLQTFMCSSLLPWGLEWVFIESFQLLPPIHLLASFQRRVNTVKEKLYWTITQGWRLLRNWREIELNSTEIKGRDIFRHWTKLVGKFSRTLRGKLINVIMTSVFADWSLSKLGS